MVKDATRLLHDGDTVTVDGRTGSVTVVGRG
jgi:phosphohistidine swiveling domain-containing protein